MGSISAPSLAVLAPGTMGAAIAARLSVSGAGTILTNLEGRSESTICRAHSSNMQHASYEDIVQRASYIFSIVPPSEALNLAETIVSTHKVSGRQRPLVFIDCNAVNPESMKRMQTLFDGTGITLLDGVIMGTLPTDSFNPGIYVSADPKDTAALDDFTQMANGLGLNVISLKGEGAGIGDASAVKMVHSVGISVRPQSPGARFLTRQQGIVKGTVGLFMIMILAANAASPSTAKGLAHALNLSHPTLADILIRLVPICIPKAYRFVFEMGEMSSFTGGDGAEVFDTLSKTYGRVATDDRGDVADTLLRFVEQAKEISVVFAESIKVRRPYEALRSDVEEWKRCTAPVHNGIVYLVQARRDVAGRPDESSRVQKEQCTSYNAQKAQRGGASRQIHLLDPKLATNTPVPFFFDAY
ncbi:hypothetical protein R3P38DRAFT_3222972 [Favolaschia claudopus]|uniref:6-phosphogluconate dehydrogenase C-terminal domain-like protein n=1 Tax=Favolaschia claudopus TaxID=2862362 RepID=A0AAV9ZXQ9_9AGAR